MRVYLKIIFFIAVLTVGISYAQNRSDALKRQAQLLMNEGRYGEAIDQLNKYIASNPRTADGYHIRGLCFEQRLQYWDAVFDLRRALRLTPNDSKIRSDLARIISVWHKQLYQKIDGHKRDIAIDPDNAFAYLEIGKSYRWLEEWYDAERWYDEYLKRDDNASPDEIIRYSVILGKTRSIVKGERILKKFVGRYPDDWRLWSRYGYFTLWLGKNKIAEDAFTKSLSFKPFFEEAEDGLDLAKKQGYLNVDVGRDRDKGAQEYAIDRYYRLLEKNPDNDDVRFELLFELVNKNRYEEAFQQLQYLQPKHAEEEKFKTISKTVTNYRDSTFNRDVNHYTEILKENPTDNEAVIKLADAYANLFYYDSAIEVLSEYLQDIPDDKDLDVRFKYAKYTAWNYEWEKSIQVLDKLIHLDPANLEYKFLRAQIGVWTSTDTDVSEEYLLENYQQNPKSVDLLLSLASLYSWKNDFLNADKYFEEARVLSPNNKQISDVANIINLRKSQFDEVQIYQILVSAAKYVQSGDCESALKKYDEYYSKTNQFTRQQLIEYASIANCAKQYRLAVESYDKLLAEQYDVDLAFQRIISKANSGDTLNTVSEIEKLAQLKEANFETNSLLALAYSSANQPKKAEIVLRRMLQYELDEEKKIAVERQLLSLSTTYLNISDLDNSERIFREFKRIDNNKEYENAIDAHQIFLVDQLLEKKDVDYAGEIIDKLESKEIDSSLVKDFRLRKMFYGDALVGKEEYGNAENVYFELLTTSKDTAEISALKLRESWIPEYGFGKGLGILRSILSYILPYNFSLSPFTSYYTDNLKFIHWTYGLNFETVFLRYLVPGINWQKYHLSYLNIRKDFVSLKGKLGIPFTKNISVNGSYGIVNIDGESKKNIGDITLRIEKPGNYSLIAQYENNDARLMLFSPYMMYNRLHAQMYTINGTYQYKNVAKLYSQYRYFEISDKNKGNDFTVKLGRSLFLNGMVGYEFYFIDYAFVTPFYYSPQNFTSHSIWGEYNWDIQNDLKILVSGKIGYVPAIDFNVTEMSCELKYNPLLNFLLNAKVGYLNGFRYDSSYEALSFFFSFYWNL